MMNSSKSLLAIAVALCSIIVVSGADDVAVNDKGKEIFCNTWETCRDCIRTPDCAWCHDVDHGGKPRCFSSTVTPSSCQQNFTINPQAYLTYQRNDSLTKRFEKSKANSNQNIVQIWPQEVALALRINQPYRLEMRYTRAADYPIDIYFLMDLSQSMNTLKNTLSSLGAKLASTMRDMTSDFRLGFGSFVDKPVMPYVSTIPAKLLQPCDGCAAPYGYRNHMSLNPDAALFSTRVREAQISGNLDAPEGGFDALMQVIVCNDAIGWRPDARRLIVFATDADFHFAGDGKLGGIIEPNDGECHLNDAGEYTMSKEQDYPSIGQINDKAKANSINIIFAVTTNFSALYKQLASVIEASSSSTLSDDSSNVVELVRDEYQKISSSIQMTHDAPSNVKITYYSACKDGVEKETSKCEDIQIGDEVAFNAEIVASSCPENSEDWSQQIEIKPTGIKESLIIKLKLHCACEDCEIQNQTNSALCSGQGMFMCGICECNESFVGEKCECKESVSFASSASCSQENSIENQCSGRGICECNQCRCNDKRFSGKFCECDNEACDFHCSGPDHGTCICGSCDCKPGWGGKACECMTSKEPCMPPGGGEICSGHGECKCGQCKCDITEKGRYTGKHCENCPTCSKRCQELKNCVQCQMHQTGPLKNSCSQNCSLVVNAVDKISSDENKNEQQCIFYDEDECTFTFKYAEKGDVLTIDAQRQRECPPKALVWQIVLSVIGATVLIGLATLILWKIITTIHDRREFSRFERERSKAKWDAGDNPLYKEATQTFKNPTLGNKK